MAITLVNITFNSIDNISIGSPFATVIKSGRTADSINSLNTKAEAGTITKEKFAQSIGVVNAVDIDWNGAQVAGKH